MNAQQTDLPNPSTPDNPFSYILSTYDAKNFYGRNAEVERILWGAISQYPTSYSITGVKFIGKTTLIRFLQDPKGAIIRNWEALRGYDKEKLTILSINCRGRKVEWILKALYEELHKPEHRLKERAGEHFPNKGAGHDIIALEEAIEGVLKALVEASQRVVICLDEFDTAASNMSDKDDNFLRTQMDRQCFILVTDKPLVELTQQAVPSSLVAQLLTNGDSSLGLLTEADARLLLEKPLEKAAQKFTEAEINFLLHAAGRHPCLLAIAGQFLLNLQLETPQDNYAKIREVLTAKDSSACQELEIRLMNHIAALPAVQGLFTYLWNWLSSEEQDALKAIAAGGASEVGLPILTSLQQNSFIMPNDFAGQEWSIFSELFDNFVEVQKVQPTAALKSKPRQGKKLTSLEQRLLEHLQNNKDQIWTVQALKQHVWKQPNVQTGAVEAALYRLRHSLQTMNSKDIGHIERIRKQGFRYVPPSSSAL